MDYEIVNPGSDITPNGFEVNVGCAGAGNGCAGIGNGCGGDIICGCLDRNCCSIKPTDPIDKDKNVRCPSKG